MNEETVEAFLRVVHEVQLIHGPPSFPNVGVPARLERGRWRVSALWFLPVNGQIVNHGFHLDECGGRTIELESWAHAGPLVRSTIVLKIDVGASEIERWLRRVLPSPLLEQPQGVRS